MKIDRELLEQFIKDAIQDGFSIEPTYGGGESVETAAKLSKEGFLIHILNRSNEANITIWGPDDLQIKPPNTYNFNELKARLSRCQECGAKNVSTQRVSFAGRVCVKCLPNAQKKYEYEGWTN